MTNEVLAEGIGTIIFLNGTSSSGKTTLSLALQELLEEPFQHVALDQFRDGMPAKYRGLNAPEGTPGARGLNVVPVRRSELPAYTEVQFGDDGRKLLKGMRRAVVALAQVGNNLIIDDIILESTFLDDYLSVMQNQRVYFVGVRCPLDVIEQREATRLGRFPGTAMSHYNICHLHDCYDIEVNTAEMSPQQCANAVIDRIRSGPPEAFDQLRSAAQTS
jgi:chloramphenicol 3-O phosphotransferase